MADDGSPPAYVRTTLGDNIDLSTMKVLKEIYESSNDKNIVSSTLGLMVLLSLYNLGAGPRAEEDITKFLIDTDLNSKHVRLVSEIFKQLSVLFSEMDPEYLSFANKIFVSNDYTLNEKFAASAREYRSELDKLDFSNPEEAAAIINQWAAEKTNGHITSPVSKEMLIPAPAGALFNVIYFNGLWNVSFNLEETKEKDFHVSRGTVVKKPMMHLLEPLHYTQSKELGAKMIALPYTEKGFRMVVVLPDEKDGLSSVLEKTASKGLLSDVFKLNSFRRDVDLDMPKFDIRTKIDFNDILSKLGLGKLFEEAATGIVQDVPVKISKVFQEASIKVNEEGATAGAFTGAIMVPYAEFLFTPTPIKFTVDHPFLYAILYEDKILFAGTYSE